MTFNHKKTMVFIDRIFKLETRFILIRKTS
jgi:hypothetical protein